MKKRLVLWGENAQKEKQLIAVALKEEENMVEIYTFPLEVATEEFAQLMMNEWRNERKVAFPEKYEKTEKPLNLSDDLLPEDLTVDREDVVNRAQTEWNFIVMSSKMRNAFQSELEDLRSRIDRLDKFDSGLWEEMKTFWDKVQEQIREKNLFGEHATTLRKSTDEAFDQMKALRRKMDEAYREESKKIMAKFMEELDDIEQKVEKGLGLKPLFEELKEVQRRFNKANLTRNDRSTVWPKLDGLFKDIKAKRFGDKSNQNKSAMGRLERRYKGLQKAISKMEGSIRKDKKDLHFEEKRMKKTDGQLEQQIRKAKLKMIKERINSKENKLEDMHDTRKMLEKKMEKEAEKEKQKELEREKEKAQKEAEAKIKEKIEKQKGSISKEEEEKLKKAVGEVKEGESSDKEEKASSKQTSKKEENLSGIMKTAAAVSQLSFEEEE
jgi:hypothetical protein